jgi:hypothetical protein
MWTNEPAVIHHSSFGEGKGGGLNSFILVPTYIRNGIMPHLWGINLSHIYAREVR